VVDPVQRIKPGNGWMNGRMDVMALFIFDCRPAGVCIVAWEGEVEFAVPWLIGYDEAVGEILQIFSG
jgi:hypothetical protein